jgi:acyl-CoA reductase-like NAD-dependent aldehyde dehydrogenase
MKTEPLMLGGERVPSADGKAFAVIEPALGKPFAEVAEAGAEEVKRAVQPAYQAFEQGKWPRLSATERGRILLQAAILVRKHVEEIAVVEARNAGKPIRDARGESQCAYRGTLWRLQTKRYWARDGHACSTAVYGGQKRVLLAGIETFY